MKVKELIEHLSKLDPELHVYGFCDHGQTPEMCQIPTVSYTQEAWHTLHDYTFDEDIAKDYSYNTKVVIL